MSVYKLLPHKLVGKKTRVGIIHISHINGLNGHGAIWLLFFTNMSEKQMLNISYRLEINLFRNEQSSMKELTWWGKLLG